MSDTEPGGRRDFMTTLVVVVLLTLVSAGTGFAVGALVGDSETAATPSVKAIEEPEQPSEPHAEHALDASDEGQSADEKGGSDDSSLEEVNVVRIPPVLTTIAEPKGKWIRLEGSILVGASSETKPELLAEQAGEQILSYLRTVRLSQLESPSGILGIRDDLDETVRTLSEGEVRGVLVHGLVVE